MERSNLELYISSVVVQDKGFEEFAEAVQTVLKTEMGKLYDNINVNPVQFNSAFLEANPKSARHIVSGKFTLHVKKQLSSHCKHHPVHAEIIRRFILT